MSRGERKAMMRRDQSLAELESGPMRKLCRSAGRRSIYAPKGESPENKKRS